MKARDIENRLQRTLPAITDRFTIEQGLDSIVPSGTTATATTPSAHNISPGQKVLIAGASAPVDIDTISRVGTTATVTTLQDHDLTEKFFAEVVLSGATEAEFNGTFPLLTVPNRRTFTIEVADSGPTSVTGSPILEEPGLPFGYNGLVTVDATPTSTTFEYTLPQSLTVPAAGANMRVITGLRIHAAITAERALDIFESQDINNLEDGELVLFVILGDAPASRDRASLSDAVSSAGVSGDNRQKLISSVNCLIFQKVSKDASGADARDDMEDTVRDIIRVLVGWSPPASFAVDSGHKLRFVNHGLFDYNTAIYVHSVEFELVEEINNEDLNIEPTNVAFRDIVYSLTSDQGEQVFSGSVDLDDEPLGA